MSVVFLSQDLIDKLVSHLMFEHFDHVYPRLMNGKGAIDLDGACVGVAASEDRRGVGQSENDGAQGIVEQDGIGLLVGLLKFVQQSDFQGCVQGLLL